VDEPSPTRAPLRLPDPRLVVLVGTTAAGESHWAPTAFAPDQVVASDRLRAVVGTGERASAPAATRSSCST
jgi:predicted kinase